MVSAAADWSAPLVDDLGIQYHLSQRVSSTGDLVRVWQRR